VAVLVVSVLSLKGGVGKTSLVLGLAGAALDRGVPTLVVDLDPQANATMGLDATPAEATVADVLDEPRRSLARALTPSGWLAGNGSVELGTLDVLGGDDSTLRHDEPTPTSAGLRKLGTALSRVSETYDLAVVDCPPSLGRLTRSALVASRRALVVTEPGLFAVHAADRALRAVAEERRLHNSELQPLGVAVNRYRERSAEHRFRLDELRDLFGPLVLTPPVPERSVIQQAQGVARPVQLWHNPAGREVSQAFDRYLSRLLRTAKRRTRT
jgi:chromosome partitioning protein